MLRNIIFWSFFTCASHFVQAQNNNPFNNQDLTIKDTLNESDTIINKNGFFSLFKGKPGKAALYSLLIPGGGQIYNKKWWKVPLAWGVDGGLAYLLVWNRKQYSESQASYIQALKNGDANAGSLKIRRDYYRKNREYAYVWLILGHLLTVVDAYVDQHLMDFDVGNDLTNFDFNAHEPSLIAKIGFRINLNHNSNHSEKISAYSY